MRLNTISLSLTLFKLTLLNERWKLLQSSCQVVSGALSTEVEETLTRPMMNYDEFSHEVDWLRGRGFNPIPVPEGRKEVQGYSWKQYQTQIMSREDFDRISQYHLCNVGIVCGPSGRTQMRARGPYFDSRWRVVASISRQGTTKAERSCSSDKLCA